MQNMNKVQQGQSFLDVIIQQTGKLEETINSAILNNASLTDEATIGSEFNVEKTTEKTLYQFQNRRPATAIENNDTNVVAKSGIGYMQIGKTFKVS